MFGLFGKKLRIEGDLLAQVRANVWQLRAMPADDADAVLEAAGQVVRAIAFEACGGIELDDEMRATIATQIALLCYRMPESTRPGALRILVYPDVFFQPHREHVPIRIGEVGDYGAVVLAWRDVLLGGLSPTRLNLVAHELAHVIDGVSGDIDGVPPLPTLERSAAWRAMIEDELDEHRLAIARDRQPLISAYAATEASEFFAEATTYFLQQGAEVQKERPRLYEHLAEFYRLDPASWTQPADEPADPRLDQLEQGRREFLIEEYGKSVVEHPDFSGGHLELARLLVEDGRPEEALRHLDTAIELLPGEAELHRERGTRRVESGDLAGAVLDYTHALRLAPGWVEVLCDRAYARRLMGARDSALEDLRVAVKEDPESDLAHAERGAVLIERRAWLGALEAYEQALALFPDDTGHLQGRATALYGLGDFEAALAEAQRAIDMGDDWPELLTLHAMILEALDEEAQDAEASPSA